MVPISAIYRLSDGTRNRAIDKDRIAELSHKLSAIESEINFYQRRISGVEEEIKRIKQENNGLITQLQRSRTVSILNFN
jgi:chromosome segregation ATPase